MLSESEPSGIASLWEKAEALSAELEPFIHQAPFGQVLKHPLVNDILYSPVRNAEFNHRLSLKKKALEEAERERDFSSYIFVHERPWRFDALCNILTTCELVPKEAAKLVFSVWIDSENIHENLEGWKELISKNRSLLFGAMSSSDRLYFDGLPDNFEIYRGCSERNKNGISWTLDEAKAKWFSRRGGGKKPLVLKKNIFKKDVAFFTDQRGEKEVVCL